MLAGFTVWTLPTLREDQQESAKNVLLILSQQVANLTAALTNQTIPGDTPNIAFATQENDAAKSESWAEPVNGCFIASLCLSIVAVLLAMLSKQYDQPPRRERVVLSLTKLPASRWIREYTKPLGPYDFVAAV